MAKRTPRTITADEDQAGGRTTYNADDGYLAWQDTTCLGSVSGSDEGRLVCAEYRIKQRRQAEALTAAVPTPPACPGCGADINAYSVYVSGQFRCLVCARVLTSADYGTIDEDEDEATNA